MILPTIRSFVSISGVRVRLWYPETMRDQAGKITHKTEILVPLVEEVTGREVREVAWQPRNNDPNEEHAVKFVFKVREVVE